jgi:TRAP-type C4-dicarboxylate transport system substrate-binding protein
MQQKHVKWVIAHEPIGLFLKVAETFAKEVNEQTNGMFNIEVLSLSDYAAKYNDGKAITKHDLLGLIDSGAIEMSHIYSNWLGDYNKDLHALDLPFLFKDHNHVDKVLEGEIGKELLANVAKNSNIQGLAFTYSGGYKIVPAKKAITKVEDFQGLDIRTSKSPVCMEIFSTLGATPNQSIDIEHLTEAGKAGLVDGGESTYVRVFPLNQTEAFSYINETNHNLLLTSIIVNKDWMSQFDQETQQILSDAAFTAAREERRQSVADVPGIIAEFKSKGVELVTMSVEEKQKFVDATSKVYDKFSDYFTPGLVQKIQLH